MFKLPWKCISPAGHTQKSEEVDFRSRALDILEYRRLSHSADMVSVSTIISDFREH